MDIATGSRRRIFPAAALAAVILLLCGGCFFGGGSSEPELMEFTDEEPSAPVAAPVVAEVERLDVSVAPLVLERLNYIYSYQVWLETLRRAARDLRSVQESGSGGEESPGLEWVIDVHEVTAEADRVFALFLAVELPATQAEAYFDLFVQGIEAVQVLSYGSDRLLAAALVVGPGGRTADTLDLAESVRFQTYLRESSVFLGSAEGILERALENASESVSGVRLR